MTREEAIREAVNEVQILRDLLASAEDVGSATATVLASRERVRALTTALVVLRGTCPAATAATSSAPTT